MTDITVKVGAGLYYYSPTDSLNMCNSYIQNNYIVGSLTIIGQGNVTVDCLSQQKFLKLGTTNSGRILDVTLENINLIGGVSVK